MHLYRLPGPFGWNEACIVVYSRVFIDSPVYPEFNRPKNECQPSTALPAQAREPPDLIYATWVARRYYAVRHN